MLLGKSKVQSRNGGVILESNVPIGHVLNPGIVANRVAVGICRAMVSRNAGHSLGRVIGRDSRKVFGSYFCLQSVNRWCTNAMLARSNARDRLQKSAGPHSGLMLAHELTDAVTRSLGRDLHAREHV
jgi:hypothetical protein